MTDVHNTPNGPDDEMLMLHAYVDGELDTPAALALERRIAADPQLAAELLRLQALRSALGQHVSKDIASDELRARIARIGQPARPAARSFDWRAMAASVLVASFLASSGTFYAQKWTAANDDVAVAVAGHRRALLAAQYVDVVSSDRHTVKPWFNSKLAISPAVVDLAMDGFPLLGGRVDLVHGQPVPVLVYRKREHFISVFTVPDSTRQSDEAAPHLDIKDGYNVLEWQGAGFSYLAVSDMELQELQGFVGLWRKALKTM
jgi:anti-sigma factor RsiW